MVSYRKLCNINQDDFRAELRTLQIHHYMAGTPDDMVLQLSTALISLIDKYAPIISRIVTLRPHAPWYKEPIRDAKRLRRKLERIWRKKRTKVASRTYRDQCAVVAKEIYSAKSSYYSTKIAECKQDTKMLHKLTQKLIGNNTMQSNFPTCDSDSELADNFRNFFDTKITNLRSKLHVDTQNTDEPLYLTNLTHLRPATEDEIQKVVKSSANKSCSLDFMPTWLLKDCITELLPVITTIINTSMTTGVFPDSFKEAIIRPHIKKSNMNAEDYSSFRPVSNLSFLSKITEKIVASRIEEHLDKNHMSDPLQSAYRTSHSTETALHKVKNDIISSLDKRKCVVFVSLDLSAAFDTVDHHLFTQRLNKLYGIHGTALVAGSNHICQTGHTECVSTRKYPVHNFYPVECHKGQYWVQGCTHSTYDRYQISSHNMTLCTIAMPMIRSYIWNVMTTTNHKTKQYNVYSFVL